MKSKCVMLLLMTVVIVGFSANGQTGMVTGRWVQVDKKMTAIPVSQTARTSDVAKYIESNIAEDSNKIRAAFYWVASSFTYDVPNMYNINFRETQEARIARAMSTKTGVCAHYSAVFAEICTQMGYRAYVVRGYTMQNGRMDYMPHGWCAVERGGKWRLYDPTWASGYVQEGKFTRKLNNEFYETLPAVFVKTHMPFDMMWQLLDHPFSFDEFNQGKLLGVSKSPIFTYADTLAKWWTLNEVQQKEAALERLERNGTQNGMVYDEAVHLKQELEYYAEKKKVDKHNADGAVFNAAVNDFNESVNSFNRYINYYNKQFKPTKSDAEIQAMFDASDRALKLARDKVNSIKQADSSLAPMIVTFKQTMDELEPRIEEQRVWLKKYFSKGKMGRSGMFTKLSWMGIPLN